MTQLNYDINMYDRSDHYTHVASNYVIIVHDHFFLTGGNDSRKNDAGMISILPRVPKKFPFSVHWLGKNKTPIHKIGTI